jgi:ornithine lipid ester-linked acyl 2-hydroxylase
MFYDVAQFRFADELAKNWLSIRDEMTALTSGEFKLWPEHSLYGDKGWETFGLYAFGQRQADGCARCPHTERALRQIPGLMMAGFSRLAPGAHILPHRGYEGYAGYVLRLHLGLAVPDGCALRVTDETRTWKEGECLVFDDSFEHEAWNRSSVPRTVLLIDFLNPLRKRPLVLNPKFTPELIRFIENDHLPGQPISQRWLWYLWKLCNPGLVRQARQSVARDRAARV